MDYITNPLSDEDVTYSILQFLFPEQRISLRGLSQQWNQFAGTEKFSRWMCLLLNEDGRLYIPPRPPPGLTWKNVLIDLWPLRYLWTLDPKNTVINGQQQPQTNQSNNNNNNEEDDDDVPSWWRRDPAEALKKYNIGVLVRFRPEKEKDTNNLLSGDKPETTNNETFYLPLHQRLAIIRSREKRKQQKNNKNLNQIKKDKETETNPVLKTQENNENVTTTTTNKLDKKTSSSLKKKKPTPTSSALKTLQGEGGWFGSDWKKAAFNEVKQNHDGSSNGEGGDGNEGVSSSLSAHIHDVDPMSARVVAVAPGVGLREFKYDYVLPSRSTQSSVYEAATRRLLMDFLNGINATILVYGQTGSGKTFTMFGEQPAAIVTTPRVKPTHEEDDKGKDKERDKGEEMRKARLEKFDSPNPTPNSSDNPQNDDDGQQRRLNNEEDEITERVIKLSLEENSKVEEQVQVEEQVEVKKFTYKEKALRGIVPRAAEEVLIAMKEKRKMGIEASITVSYVEVFGDEVTDLLHNGARCGHSKVSAQRYVLNGATGLKVESFEEIAECLEKGEVMKRKGATAMNDRSSRAHALFIMTLSQYDMKTDRKVKSQLFLADLGGSENVKRSEVHHGAMHDHYGHILGSQMREAVYINLGLLALKKCIDALNKGNSYVPYQDSKLTMLLSPALGGDSKTSVVVCGSMDVSDAKETVQALRFGEACSLVANNAGVHARGAAGLLEEMEEEMEKLEKLIAEKETWVSSQKLRNDLERAEEGTVEAAIAARGGEIVRVDKIIGAENERARLEELIIKRAELLGEDVDMSLAEAGFGGQFGAKAEALGGHAALRFASKSQGLKIKGKVIAEWIP